MIIEKSQVIREILNHYFFALLGPIDEEKKEEIIRSLEIINLKSGEILFEQFDSADGIYTVLSGKLEAVVSDQYGVEKVVGSIGRSETVGEMALITGDFRSATVRCSRNAILTKMSNELFLELCNENPSYALNISRIIVSRLRNTIRNVKTNSLSYTNIAIYHGDESEETLNCLQQSLNKLAHENKLFIINKNILETVLEIDFTQELNFYDKNKIENFINDKELSFNRLAFDLRGMNEHLIAILIHYSDFCILYKKMAGDPQPDFHEQLIYKLGTSMKKKIRLIFCHKSTTFMPTLTSKWLALRPKVEHTHIKYNQASDIDRIHRYITGHSNALVLGGGGAKGIAHLGILRALNEFKIPIDYISGTSMGSIIACLYDMYQNLDDVIQVSREIFMSNPTPLRDLNIFPRYSIYKGKKIDRHLNRQLKDYEIEDLWLPYFCISSNLSLPKMHIHHKGALKDAIRASLSVPGLFPPIILNNQVHVDGGVFNNNPIDIMMKKEAGNVIACRVDKEQIRKNAKIPSMLTTFVKSTVANSDQQTERLKSDVDLYFEPDVSKYGLLNWKAHDKIMDAGYRHAVEVLKSLDSVDPFRY